MSQRTITLLRDDHAARPALDTAVSRAMLLRVSEGSLGESLRIHRPARLVAFGRQDVVSRGYSHAVAAARSLGFDAVERLAGGRAAVFHAGTIAFAWSIPEPDPKTTITSRFVEIASIVRHALTALGVDAEIGELPGEYCPGKYSVNAGGRLKLMGVGQRLTRRAAHVGGVLVVDDSESIRRVLIPVYDALGISWNPNTVGSVNDICAGVGFDDVADALVAEFGKRFRLEDGTVDQETLARARLLESEHLPASPSGNERPAGNDSIAWRR